MASGHAANAQFYASLRCQSGFFLFSLWEIDWWAFREILHYLFLSKVRYAFLFDVYDKETVSALLCEPRQKLCIWELSSLTVPRGGQFWVCSWDLFTSLKTILPSQESCMSAPRLSELGLMKENVVKHSGAPLSSPESQVKDQNCLCDFRKDDLPKESFIIVI